MSPFDEDIVDSKSVGVTSTAQHVKISTPKRDPYGPDFDPWPAAKRDKASRQALDAKFEEEERLFMIESKDKQFKAANKASSAFRAAMALARTPPSKPSDIGMSTPPGLGPRLEQKISVIITGLTAGTIEIKGSCVPLGASGQVASQSAEDGRQAETHPELDGNFQPIIASDDKQHKYESIDTLTKYVERKGSPAGLKAERKAFKKKANKNRRRKENQALRERLI